MLALLKLFLSIALLRKGPQDVPYSRFLFVALLAVLFIADLLINQFLSAPGKARDPMKLLMFLIFANVIVYGLIYLLIYVHGLANRAIQTMSALLGIELVIKLAQLPLFFVALLFAESKGIMLLLNYAIIMTFGWELIANVHIYRNALSISALRAALITLVMFSVQIFLVVKYFPENA